MRKKRITRRRFVTTAAASSLAFTYIPRRAWGANDRLYVAGIGVGGQGGQDIKGVADAGGTVVALCDVDENRARSSIENFPSARFYHDFRVMLEKEKGIDAVTVSTPDHVHAVAALSAMSLGKHVYCQKPLAHSIYEARTMASAAEHYGVQTQMGNQAHAMEPIRRAVELVRAGIIGPVREAHSWSDRPTWPQGQAALDERKLFAGRAKPDDLNFDLWLGPAEARSYNACYLPFKWRGWWDFGTGALGDMACHIMDMPYWALDLGAPRSVEAISSGGTNETGPSWSTITYQFAARNSVGGGQRGAAIGPKAAVEQPAVKYVWYDGNKDGRPNVPYELFRQATEEVRQSGAVAKNTDATSENEKEIKAIDDPSRWDLLMLGDAGMMLFNRESSDWVITPQGRAASFADVPKTIARVTREDSNRDRAREASYVEWVRACRGGPRPLSSFDYAGPFTEMVLLGTLAVRLGTRIDWDAAALKVANAADADPLIRREYRRGWQLPDVSRAAG
jgi:predicted dehydrogenase